VEVDAGWVAVAVAPGVAVTPGVAVGSSPQAATRRMASNPTSTNNHCFRINSLPFESEFESMVE
jgi:hypothetical protein